MTIKGPNLRNDTKIQSLENKSNPAPEEYSIGKGTPKSDFFGVLQIRLPNEREQAQEGIFVIPSRIELDFEQWLIKLEHLQDPNPYKKHWVKFIFKSKTSYYDTIKQITHAGMSPLRLFPGLEGVGESLKYAWFEPVKDFDFE